MIEDRLVDAAASMTREQLDDLAAKWEAFTAAEQIAEAEYRKGVGYGTCNRDISDACMNALLANPGALIALARAALERLINGADALALPADPASGEGVDTNGEIEMLRARIAVLEKGQLNYEAAFDLAVKSERAKCAARTKKLEKALQPFADFSPPDWVPSNEYMTKGSPMAKQQVTAAAFRNAAQALLKTEVDQTTSDARDAEIATFRAALEKADKALEPFAETYWLTSYTETTAMTVVCHLYGEPLRDITVSSDDFRKAKAARKALAAMNQPQIATP